MGFTMRLLLNDERRDEGHIASPAFDTTDFVDDDPEHPLFLAETCSVLAANRVRFEIKGFFREDLPVSVGDDFLYLLEDLPPLLKFITEDSSEQFSLGFCGQGVETVFFFLKSEDGRVFEVSCSFGIDRVMEKKTEKLSFHQLAGQMVTLVETYQEALRRYLPRVLDEPWNRDLFKLAAQLKK